MPRRQGYALLIALLAGTALLAVAAVLGTTLFTGPRAAPPLPPAETHAAARNPVAPAHTGGNWVATWTTAPVGAEPGTGNGLPGSTIRNTVHTSVGGDAARITLSNLYGTVPLLVDRATVNTRPVTFDGATSVTVAAGARVVSDPVVVPVAPDSDLQCRLPHPARGRPRHLPPEHPPDVLPGRRPRHLVHHQVALPASRRGRPRRGRTRHRRRHRGLAHRGQRLHRRRQHPLDGRPRGPPRRPVRGRQRGHRGQPAPHPARRARPAPPGSSGTRSRSPEPAP
ncbi:hypothetical protein SMICM304S_05592 [Streptomyces microflavus]